MSFHCVWEKNEENRKNGEGREKEGKKGRKMEEKGRKKGRGKEKWARYYSYVYALNLPYFYYQKNHKKTSNADLLC